MAVQLIDIPPLDPNIYTGPTRFMTGVSRTGNVVNDTYYGPNGTVEFARWIYVGGSGDISYTKWDGTDQVLVAIAVGLWHPILSIKINSTGTTATNLVWGS